MIKLQDILDVLEINGGKELSLNVVFSLIEHKHKTPICLGGGIISEIKRLGELGHYKLIYHTKTDKKGVIRNDWLFLSL